MKCKHSDCDRKAVSKGCCDKHYRRLIKFGDINSNGTRVIDEGNDKDRFFKKFKINDNGCWIWTRGTRPNGKGVEYPRHFVNGKSIGAHRFSYIIHYGDIPRNHYVCHKCDTPLCVNPEHLFIGEHIDNMKDMVNKGRSYKGIGEKANSSRLKNNQVIEIRESKLSQSKLSKIYGVSQTTISRIKRRICYDI